MDRDLAENQMQLSIFIDFRQLNDAIYPSISADPNERAFNFGGNVKARPDNGEALSQAEFLALLANIKDDSEEWRDLGVAERMEAEHGLDGMPSFWRDQ